MWDGCPGRRHASRLPRKHLPGLVGVSAVFPMRASPVRGLPLHLGDRSQLLASPAGPARSSSPPSPLTWLEPPTSHFPVTQAHSYLRTLAPAARSPAAPSPTALLPVGRCPNVTA